MNKKAFLPYIEWFRGLSILLIVLSHIRSSILPKEYCYVLQNATVYFLFISGFLFHYLYNPQETVVSFYIKKIQRLILPYLVAALPGFLILMAETGSVPNLVYMLLSYSTGTGHSNDTHWFVPTMVLILATFPLLRILINRKKLLMILTILGLITSLVTFRSVYNSNPFWNTLHFYGIFLFGMTTSAFWDFLSLFLKKYFWWLTVLGTALFAAIIFYAPLHKNLEMETVLEAGGLFTGIWDLDWSSLARLILIFPLLAVLMALHEKGLRLRFLGILGRMSFGIFLYHIYVISFLNSDGVNRFFNQNNVWVYLMNVFFVFGLLWLLLALVKKALGKNSVYVTGY
jgi:peptidoglycan/LPS O-acetylase OafA/YrhL